jgi:hypothetical protein
VPILHCEPWGWDNWNLATATPSGNGTWLDGAPLVITILDDSHPIIQDAGLSNGVVAFYDVFSGTNPSRTMSPKEASSLDDEIVVLARADGTNTDDNTVFAAMWALEAGATETIGIGATFPSRIVGMAMPTGDEAGADLPATDISANGYALITAAVHWLDPDSFPDTAVLAARWPLSDGSGTSPTEIVGGLIGSMRNMDAGTAWIGDAEAPTTGALCFDGVDDYVYIPNGPGNDITTHSFTVSLLARQPGLHDPDNASMENRWFTKGTYAGAAGIRYEVYQKAADLRWSLDDGVIKSELSLPAAPYVNDQWHHVVFVRDREASPTAQLRMYRDGVLDGTLTDGTATVSNPVEPLVLATSIAPDVPASVEFFDGCLDDIRIYHSALTDDQIQQLFESYVIPSANEVGEWVMY